MSVNGEAELKNYELWDECPSDHLADTIPYILLHQLAAFELSNTHSLRR